jgi:hypothetical protein
MERTIQSLNGAWGYEANGVGMPPVCVPFSARCVGDSACIRTFDTKSAPRAELCFEGITYEARVTLNGAELGVMRAYSFYSFDVTGLLRPEGNELRVALRDMGVPFGPSEGWENYGGIIRDVYIRYTDAVYIEDVVWTTALSDDFRRADCAVQVAIGGAEDAEIFVELLDARGDVAARASGNGEIRFALESPRLWSPDDPYLYTLVASVGGDRVSQKVGIRAFAARGQRFYLNGQPIFLKGVCRHDMWGDLGHSLTDAQILFDMRAIKATGCNFVRLVHYPHDRRVVEAADEIGLMVSEEPGLWWSDMHDERIVEGALDVMGRVVRRDRNRPSVVFWLAFNECIFTDEYLSAAARVCRENDPTRLVSGANCMALERTKEGFDRGGFDFYTYHPYTYDIGVFEKARDLLRDKPLLFTEWGGLCVYENRTLFETELSAMLDAWREPDGGKVLAGCCYWVWADMYEFGRGLPACRNGLLNEGLVDIYRNPRGNLDVFARLMKGMDLPKPEPYALECESGFLTGGTAVDIWASLDRAAQQAAYDRLILDSTPVEGYQHKRARRLTHGPALRDPLLHLGRMRAAIPAGPPVVIRDEIEIPVGRFAREMVVIGNVSMPWGYPAYGKRGAPGAEYVVRYEDGGEAVIPVRNGIELTTALGSLGPSRIDPVALGVSRAMRFSYDANWEHYVVNLMRVPLDPARRVDRIIVRAVSPECALLLYGITLDPSYALDR